MRILLVSSWDEPCGIAEHSAMLKEAVEAADSNCRIYGHDSSALDPRVIWEIWGNGWDLIHLNYHAAIHSRWTPDWIRRFQGELGAKVLITYHDSGVPNSQQCLDLYEVADTFVVHEPCEDLPKAIYWRQGVPDWQEPYILSANRAYETTFVGWKNYMQQPVVGTIGFPFPWKNYDELCRLTNEVGWALVLIAPGASEEQVERWKSLNPYTYIRSKFMDRDDAIAMLAGCDATAFGYVTNFPGTSAAIRMGIAARKPVLALSTCRQFRDLYLDPLGREVITWCENFEGIRWHLRNLPIQRIDPGIVALAEQDSWEQLGRKYADLYRRMIA